MEGSRKNMQCGTVTQGKRQRREKRIRAAGREIGDSGGSGERGEARGGGRGGGGEGIIEYETRQQSTKA